MRALKNIGLRLGLALIALSALAPSSAQASFGVKSLSATAVDRNGLVELRAGSHPYEYQVGFTMNQDSKGAPEGHLSELVLELPPGLVGNPLAVQRCSGQQFVGAASNCPIASQIGVAIAKVGALGTAKSPIYNLTPPTGVLASVGFHILEFRTIAEASLRTGGDYGVNTSDISIPNSLEIQSVSVSIWGVPADPRHDTQRGECLELEKEACSSEAPLRPFLALPTSCTGPMTTRLKVASLEEPGVFAEGETKSVGQDGLPAGMNSCEDPPFEPRLTAQPETAASDSPTGLHFNLHVPQREEDPEGIATAHVKDTVVSLPAGMEVNGSAAAGLGACSLTQVNLQGSGPAQCPENSKVGAVRVETPALDHPVVGSVYLARQGENPFGSLLALYVAVDDPLSGAVVKFAVKVEPDEATGQLHAVTRGLPQLPFEDVHLDFFGGPKAALTTPRTCGTYTTNADLTPWTSPEGADALTSDSFSVTSAPGGGGCPASEAQMPNAPSFEAGSSIPIAGSYSSFVLRLNRENGSQRLAALNTTLPAGVAANFTGVAECSEAQIAQAQARGNPGEGALEQASPSCPQASKLGTVNVGVGSGAPLYVQGDVYLSGPYKGAPFSLAIITPGVAGPFDLGTVVVRSALYVNEETGQGTVKSDPLPRILHGIPLDVRSVAVRIDRSGYVLNPTSCEEKAITGEAISTTGAVAQLRNRFQVGGCRGLDYTPKLSLSLKGPTRRSGHPSLKGVLTQPSGQANSRRIVIILPPTEFIDPLRTANPCTRPQFAEGKCPPASVLGKARVFTPLLAKPLEGPIYFRANGGARELPDAVADLHGRIHVVSVSFIDAVHKQGSESSRVRATLASVPDAPLTKAIIELRGGKKGTLVNSANLCKVPNLATVKMVAHNNKTQSFNQRIATSCG